MRRWLPLALAAGCVWSMGCADTDPCAGHDGTCLGLHVLGSGQVDQLQVQLSGAALLDGRTPQTAGRARTLPVTTALFLPAVSGTVDVVVAGLLAGTEIGRGRASVEVKAGAHRTVLVELGLAGADLSVPRDLAGVDAAKGDLAGADLASLDLAGADLAGVVGDGGDLSVGGPDLLGVDLTGTAPRRIFLLPAQASTLGTLSTVDAKCNTAAGLVSLGGSFVALISYPSPSPEPDTRFVRHAGRPVVLPSGAQVATDDTFFGTAHAHAINQLADGTVIAAGCVFTEFGPGGNRIPASPSDCLGWSSAAVTDYGGWGDIAATDATWALSGISTCDTLVCHVYCIEQ